MQLNTIKSAEGTKSEAKRVGRGIGSGFGKTCGRGHKGQKSRSGGFHKVGFEGGQMPLQRRLPKVGFVSRKAAFSAEVRLNEIAALGVDEVTPAVLVANRIVSKRAKAIKVISSGSIDKAVKVTGMKVTAGAKAAIEAAGGSVEA